MWPPPAARSTSHRGENSSQTRLSMSRSTMLIAAVIRSFAIAEAHFHSYNLDKLARQVLKNSLSELGLPDPRTLLRVTFFLRGYVKDKVFASPLPPNIDSIKDDRITAAISTMNHDTLRQISKEFSHRFDVDRAVGNDHIEHLLNMK